MRNLVLFSLSLTVFVSSAQAVDKRIYLHETEIFRSADDGDFARGLCYAARFGGQAALVSYKDPSKSAPMQKDVFDNCLHKVDGLETRSRISVALDICNRFSTKKEYRRDCLVAAVGRMEDVGYEKKDAPNTFAFRAKREACVDPKGPNASAESQANCLSLFLKSYKPVVPPGFVSPKTQRALPKPPIINPNSRSNGTGI